MREPDESGEREMLCMDKNKSQKMKKGSRQETTEEVHRRHSVVIQTDEDRMR